jgi:uncharacterized membrane protein
MQESDHSDKSYGLLCDRNTMVASLCASSSSPYTRRGRSWPHPNGDFAMAETYDTQALPPSTPSASLISTTLLIYALYGIAAIAGLVSSGFPLIAPFFGVLGIVAIIIAYVKRSETAGTWLASHYRWLIRTFWFSMLWALLGWLVLITLGLILIGIPIAFGIWIAATVWVIYRVVRGYILFKESKAIPGM